ncbi:MAG: hypothetical protein M3232_06370 [Thermoproteota archaeon]|nr:hypothetical protein [Thermoproteota archaeon]
MTKWTGWWDLNPRPQQISSGFLSISLTVIQRAPIEGELNCSNLAINTYKRIFDLNSEL